MKVKDESADQGVTTVVEMVVKTPSQPTTTPSQQTITGMPIPSTTGESISHPTSPLLAPLDQQHDPVDPTTNIKDAADEAGEYKVPHRSYWQIFRLFLWFGFNAWGGPMAQIALLKDRLVDKEKWISNAKFFRVYAVYQILPGPEAAELCCYFGYLAGGRWGALLGGLGFILPGFTLMLFFSWLYSLVGLSNIYFAASFKSLNIVVAAMVARAVHKIADHALTNPKTKKPRYSLLILAILAAFNSTLNLNFFITLAVFGVVNALYDLGEGGSDHDETSKPINDNDNSRRRRRRLQWMYKGAAGILLVASYIGFFVYISIVGLPSPKSLGIGVARVPDMGHLFALGLLAGCVSFGGAYTAVPFVMAEAVSIGGWMTRQTFLDGLAIGNILPAPLVIFSTFVGFVGGEAGTGGNVGSGFLGAILMTIGMFIPCFSFTIIGHSFFERLVNMKSVQAFLDGITGAVVGIIALTAGQLLRSSLSNDPVVSTRNLPTSTITTAFILTSEGEASVSAVVYILSLAILYYFKSNGNTPICLILCGAIAGQLLFLPL